MRMRKRRMKNIRTAGIFFLIAMLTFGTLITAFAEVDVAEGNKEELVNDEIDIEVKAGPTGPASPIEWDGKRGVEEEKCWKADDEYRNAETGWIHWVASTRGTSSNVSLVVNGTTYYEKDSPANVWHFYTPYYDLDTLTATLYFDGKLGPGGELVISDYCPGQAEEPEKGELKLKKEVIGDLPDGADYFEAVVRDETGTPVWTFADYWKLLPGETRTVGLDAGTYTIEETLTHGANVSYSKEQFEIIAGEKTYVTITNDFVAPVVKGTLKLTKKVIGNLPDGADYFEAVVRDSTGTPVWTFADYWKLLPDETRTVGLDAGTYTIEETLTHGANVSYSKEQFVIEAGKTTYVTITNKFITEQEGIIGGIKWLIPNMDVHRDLVAPGGHWKPERNEKWERGAGWTIRLYEEKTEAAVSNGTKMASIPEDWEFVGSTVTNQAGHYEFTNLELGKWYKVMEVFPEAKKKTWIQLPPYAYYVFLGHDASIVHPYDRQLYDGQLKEKTIVPTKLHFYNSEIPHVTVIKNVIGESTDRNFDIILTPMLWDSATREWIIDAGADPIERTIFAGRNILLWNRTFNQWEMPHTNMMMTMMAHSDPFRYYGDVAGLNFPFGVYLVEERHPGEGWKNPVYNPQTQLLFFGVCESWTDRGEIGIAHIEYDCNLFPEITITNERIVTPPPVNGNGPEPRPPRPRPREPRPPVNGVQPISVEPAPVPVAPPTVTPVVPPVIPVLEEPAPLAPPVLPVTGDASPILFYMIGMLLAGAGFFTRKYQ